MSRTRVCLEDKVSNIGIAGLERHRSRTAKRVSNARSRTKKGVSNKGVSRTPGLEHAVDGLERGVSNKACCVGHRFLRHEGCLEQGCVLNNRSRTHGNAGDERQVSNNEGCVSNARS